MTEKVLENGSQEIFARMLLEGEEHFAQGRMIDALHCFAQITREAGDDSLRCRAFNNMGVVAYSMEDMERAERMFMMALNIDPLDADALSNLSAIYKAKGDQSAGGEEEPEKVTVPETVDAHSGFGGEVNDRGAEIAIPVVPGETSTVDEKEETVTIKAMPGGNPLSIAIPCDVKVCVPNDITLMTPYLLLEQEDWFEDEMPFVRRFIKPGMNVLDIGANHGVYALTMAKLMQGEGIVVAFEPAKAPGDMLERSIKENGLENTLTLIRAGMSDRQGQAKLCINPNSELNSLYGDGPKEAIKLMTLDGIMKQGIVPPGRKIDFIKLDAEGEEIKVLKGGKKFFTKNSPLIMFEIKHGETYNYGLVQAFKDLGMDIYKLIPGLNSLVSFDDQKPLDGYQLNLFACNPLHAQELKKKGYILPKELPNPFISKNWRDVFEFFPYATHLLPIWKSLDYSKDRFFSEYEKALNFYLTSQDESLSIEERYASLIQSKNIMVDLNSHGDNHVGTKLALVRIHSDLGERSESVRINSELAQLIGNNVRIELNRPFIPPIVTFDLPPVREDFNKWFYAIIYESLEKRRTFSSYFHNDFNLLGKLIANPNCSIEMERRHALLFMRQGNSVSVEHDSRLFTYDKSDHLNGLIWRGFVDDQEKYFKNFNYSINKPLLSICIFTYNRANLLEKTLQHLVDVCDDRFEIVVSNNYSQDHTEDVLNEFKDKHKQISYFTQNKNIPAIDNCFASTLLAKGKYCYTLSDDDEIYPDGLLAAVEQMESNKSIVGAYGGYCEWERETDKILCQCDFVKTTEFFKKGSFKSIMSRFHLLWHPIVKTSVAQRHVYLYEKSWSMMGQLYCLISHGDIIVVPDLFYKHSHTVPRMEFKLVENFYHDMYRADYETVLAHISPGDPSNASLVFNSTVHAYSQGVRFAQIQNMWEAALFYIKRMRAYGLINDEQIKLWQDNNLNKVVAQYLVRKINLISNSGTIYAEDNNLIRLLINLEYEIIKNFKINYISKNQIKKLNKDESIIIVSSMDLLNQNDCSCYKTISIEDIFELVKLV